jgi:predicted O-methyltransferase YrrM
VVEIGVWKGGSVITMAKALSELGLDGVVIAIDTWLGSSDHWLSAEWFTELGFESGYPKLYHRFLNNVLTEGLEDYVVPLPIDSMNAVVIFETLQIRPDVVHIDAGHDYDSVISDLKAWWNLLAPGGMLIADDYLPETGGWPGVLKAVDGFFA